MTKKSYIKERNNAEKLNMFLGLDKKLNWMILKNLIAHRQSNKLTAIIFSLTLGSIIFVVVAANL